MLVPRAETLEGRAATLRLVRSPQPTAAAVVVQALALAQRLSVDAEAASVQREQLPVHRAHMAQEAEVVAFPPQASIL